ncbi:ABC transporter permease [Streptomyces glebosus]|uniref:ABC transporter permease n=1 Tax=Streptomyces glebosus TaxID=249580 RepID=A0A640SXX4_9ACTN|nr:ABC transporter permease subunit [Streptomyces glebosus]GFE16363.1 ABC transporter permease [Streptomyces glebosus]GHG64426.1 ABC transporter permease [Streptomyces glebosus]
MNHAMRSEWIKLTTLRTHVWSLPVYVVICLAMSGLMGYTSRQSKGIDPVALGFSGLQSGMILMVILGVLAVTHEYSSGTIRSSLLAVPKRGVYYAGKLATLMLVTVVLSAVTAVVSFFFVQSLLGDAGVAADAGIVGRMAGAAVYTTLLVAFSMGLATVLRSSTVTLGLLVPIFFMLSTILNNIPATRMVAQFLPDMAGSLILRRDLLPDSVLNGGTGLAVLAAWAVVTVAAGYATLSRRDA